MVRRASSQQSQRLLKFDQKLILFQWVLSLFEVPDFDKLTADLKDPALERFDENNVSLYYQQLMLRLWYLKELPSDVLLAYDNNIVRHWKKITEKRNQIHILYPKYFQYLSLLFTEIYLDRYFRNPEKLLTDLNSQVSAFNAGQTQQPQSDTLFPNGIPDSSQIKPYKIEDLNKIAFWCATGSGKTLIMHVNIMQYKHYLNLHGKEKSLNRVILLTPNEGLSNQHLEEFKLSSIKAGLFYKDDLLSFSGDAVEVIDIHKLRDESGEKTVAVEAFEDKNLVLVDEGHRGMVGAETGQWMQKRSQLCENGFSFEYSATFGQAMKASSNKNLEQEYARCILFDYSYKYFYKDGYGKDYQIFNLEDDSDANIRRKYLTACLLTFYQQKKLYNDRRSDFIHFLIEQPLWIFVGGSVNAVRTQRGRKVSDVTDILLFLSEFVSDRSKSIEYIDGFLKGQSGLLDGYDNDLFARTFTYLYKSHLTAGQVFDDILKVLFNASSEASLHVENLKGSDGEIALRLGENDPFGVINVGDTSELCKLCEEYEELVVTDRDFSGSLFRELSDSESKINILIGSKKFTEGWSSWRVSTMGMMNIGRNEGPQIIQLFGRGVRLKGFEYCLKRSRQIQGVSAPSDIEILETLSIFGIRADYMRQFKEYLEDEGLPTNENRIEFILPVIKDLNTNKLKTIRLKEGFDFKENKINLELIDDFLKDKRIVLDWYPKIQAFSSTRKSENLVAAIKDERYFTKEHVAFMDIDNIYFELQKFKNERSWYNINLHKSAIEYLLRAFGWYRLYIPKEELEFKSYEQVQHWQEIAITLLKKYCDRYYKFRKAEFENDYLEYYELTTSDPNFINEYRFLVEQSMNDIIDKLEELKDLVTSGQFRDFEFQNIKGFRFHNHLYYPLVYVNSNLVEVKPIVLENPGELDFVLDLQSFCQKQKSFFDGKEMYLLRNMSKGRGIGFFEAGNFHPDFILWLLANNKQYITFVDPKGLRNIEGLTDPKILFHKTIKELESRLGDPEINLKSFIVSSTPLPDVSWWSDGMTKEQFDQHNVLFQKEDKDIYIENLMRKIMVT